MLYHPKAVNKELVIHAVQIRDIIEKEAYFEPSNIVVGKKITDTFLKTNYRV